MADHSRTRHDIVDNIPGLFCAIGVAPDVDVAFDGGVDASLTAYGEFNAHTTLAGVSPDSIEVVVTEPASLERAMLLARAKLASGVTPGIAYAFAYAADRGFSRRRVTLRLHDVGLELGEREGQLYVVDERLADAIGQALSEDGAGIAADERIEQVILRMLRDRYKPAVVVNRGKSLRQYVSLRDGELVGAFTKTVGEARRELVADIRAGTATRGDIVGVVTREGGLPFVSVAQERVARRATLRVTLATAKDPETSAGRAAFQPVGWVFIGAAREDGEEEAVEIVEVTETVEVTTIEEV